MIDEDAVAPEVEAGPDEIGGRQSAPVVQNEHRRRLLSMLLASGGAVGLARLTACAMPVNEGETSTEENESSVGLSVQALLADADTIAALRGLSAPSSGNPTRIVLGTSVVGDGGGGVFLWRTGLSAFADDNATVIKPNNYSSSGRWIRMSPGQLNVSSVAGLRALAAPTTTNDFRHVQGHMLPGDGGGLSHPLISRRTNRG